MPVGFPLDATISYNQISGVPDFSPVAFSGDYTDLGNKPTIPAAQVQVDMSQSDSGAMDYIKNKISRVWTNPARALNSAFQISTTCDAIVSYAIDIAATISLTTGQVGQVILEFADDAGMSTNLTTVNSATNGNTGSLTIGLNLTQTATATVGGVIPRNKYARLRTANITSTPSFSFRSAQEVIF